MNRDTIIGFVLIALVLIGFSWYNSPSKEDIEAARLQDSLAVVAQENAQKTEKQKTLAKQEQEEVAKTDSSALFFGALNGKSEKVVLKNTKLELAIIVFLYYAPNFYLWSQNENCSHGWSWLYRKPYDY